MSAQYPTSKLRFRRGAFLQATGDDAAEFWPDAIAAVLAEGVEAGSLIDFGESGRIAEERGLDLESVPVAEGLHLPAFYDVHFHWVQDAVRLEPKDSLLDWLQERVFPEEARYGDPAFADREAKAFWRRVHSYGTVGGFCYSSSHDLALDAALSAAPKGFRIGNALMSANCPEPLRQADPAASVNRGIRLGNCRYAVSPRFAPMVDPDSLGAAARLAAANRSYCQTHLSETPQEAAWALETYREHSDYRDVRSYADIYRRAGLLGPRTILGHCIHLSEHEWKIVADSGAAIASCPTSNAPVAEGGLGSGLFDFRRADALGIPWALATDIGAGPYPSMFDVMASFVAQNRRAGVAQATYTRALYRSSAMGAALTGKGRSKGRFAPGFDFDAVRVDWPGASPERGDAESLLQALIEGAPSREALCDLATETIVEGETRFVRAKPRTLGAGSAGPER